MSRWLQSVTRGDARTVVFGILAVLILLTIVVQRTNPDVRLFRFLNILPLSVTAVVIEPERPVPARALAGTFFGIPNVTLPHGLRPVATLLVESGSGERAVALLERSAANRAGILGPSVAGFIAVGDDAALARLRSEDMRTPSLSPAALRFLRQSQSAGVRVLARTSFVARRIPRGVLQSVPPGVLALSLEASEQRLGISGILPGDFSAFDRGASVLLGRPLADAVLVLDGVPASQLLPADLPPVLEGLKEGSGVRAEIDRLARALGESHGVVAVSRGPAGGMEVVVGFDVRGRPREEVKQAAEALLQRRLELVGAVVERVRVGDQVIRHRRPRATGEKPKTGDVSLIESSRDGRDIVRAPMGAGIADLVVVLDDASLMFGTSEAAVVSVASGVGRERPTRNLQFFADGLHLRQLPVVALALRGLPEHLRPWLEALGTVRLELDASPRALNFEGSAEFSPGVPGG